MLFNKSILPVTILMTSLLSVGCSSSNNVVTQNTTSNTLINTDNTYENKPLVKAFFHLENQMKLPVEEFYKKVRSFDVSNTFIEKNSTPQEVLVTDIGTCSFKTFSDGELIELVVSTLSDSPFDDDKSPKISSIELILKDENISFKFINYSEQIGYMVKKSDSNVNSQDLIYKKISDEKNQEIKYFDIVKKLNEDSNITIKELAKKVDIEFVELHTSEKESIYSYIDDKSSTIVEVVDNKIKSVNCSIEDESLNSNYGETFLEFNNIDLDKNKVNTIITLYNLNDMMSTSKMLNEIDM